MNPSDLWKATLGELETMLSKMIYISVFEEIKVGKVEENTIELICPNSYIVDQINKKYYGFLKNILDRIGKIDYKIVFKLAEVVKKETDVTGLPLFTKPKDKQNDKEPTVISEGLSEKYTFDTFIVGPSNRLAHAIATAISENPGKVYNPFFLHAGVGLGKTHLIHAIGNEIIKTNPKLRVVYSTAESFMNELIETIQEGRNKNYTANKFRNKFRKTDVLLVDDIQFIAGRGEATQEEFFHTFNALYMAQKQIVLTSDRPPKELSRLDARITSRFASGVVADMQAPDVETRSAILRQKRNYLRSVVPNEVVDFIAQNVETNIRELEGTFLQVITQAKADGVEVTKDFAAKVLGQALERPNVNINDILRTVCTYFNIKITDLKGSSRVKEYVIPRQISMYLLYKLTGTPYMAIGDLLGGRDHTTIMHGTDKIESLVGSDVKLKQDISNIKKTLKINVD